MAKNEHVPEYCPHCGRSLTPWEQVLLSVDRALMCRGCWYRILLDYQDTPPPASPKDNSNDGDKHS